MREGRYEKEGRRNKIKIIAGYASQQTFTLSLSLSLSTCSFTFYQLSLCPLLPPSISPHSPSLSLSHSPSLPFSLTLFFFLSLLSIPLSLSFSLALKSRGDGKSFFLRMSLLSLPFCFLTHFHGQTHAH